jgi:hypothetical protein
MDGMAQSAAGCGRMSEPVAAAHGAFREFLLCSFREDGRRNYGLAAPVIRYLGGAAMRAKVCTPLLPRPLHLCREAVSRVDRKRKRPCEISVNVRPDRRPSTGGFIVCSRYQPSLIAGGRTSPLHLDGYFRSRRSPGELPWDALLLCIANRNCHWHMLNGRMRY